MSLRSGLRCCSRLARLASQAGSVRFDAAASPLASCAWVPCVARRGSLVSRGFAADAGAAAAPEQSPPPWDGDGAFLTEEELPSSDGRQVFRLRAPYSPRARTPLVQGNQLSYSVPVWRLDGSCTERSVTLHGAVFDVPIRPDLVHRCVRWQLAKAQAGTHAAKDRSEVSGSGKKPWAQKGTGRARAGSKRSPQFRGGGAVHGPRTRSHAHHLPRKVRRLALKAVLSAKLAEGNLIVVEHAGPGTPKTAALVAALEGLTRARGEPPSDTAPSTLIVDARGEDERPAGADLRRAAANLKRVHVLPSQGLNVYSILQQRTLVMTEQAAHEVVERLLAPIRR